MELAVETKRGEYCVLEVALPGEAVEAAGIILHDSSDGRIGVRLRRDWDVIAEEDDAEVLEALEEDLRDKAAEMGAAGFLEYLEETLSNVLRISDREAVLLGGFDSTLERLYREIVPATVREYVTHLPVFAVAAAAGSFGAETEERPEPEEWVEAPPDLKLSEGMFVATVTGRSMEPKIPADSQCVFRRFGAGSREGLLVLVQNLAEPMERYTIKRYRSEKVKTDEGWKHSKIVMEPLNPEYEAWELEPEAGAQDQLRVIAEYVRVL